MPLTSLPDWIDTYMSATAGLQTPEIFRLWTGIFTIASTLQRRCYTYTNVSIDPLCPNLYIGLVGPPGTGKNLAINAGRRLLSGVRGLTISSDNFTKASFVAEMETANRVFINGTQQHEIFSSLSVPMVELSTFIGRNDHDIMKVLTHIFDNPPYYKEPRTSVHSREVDKPNLNIIGGVTPDYLGDLFPEIAWGQGLTSRWIFIYSDKIKVTSNANYFTRRREQNLDSLIKPLIRYYDFGGEFTWSEEAQNAHINWLDADEPGAPEHSRLQHYASRRSVHVQKLAMISSVSSGKNLYVDIEDYERAHEWLSSAEAVMPDVFRAMAQRSDSQLMLDMHQHLWMNHWNHILHSKRTSIENEILWKFLADRTTSNNIQNVINAAERSGLIRRDPKHPAAPNPRWIPKPLNEYSKGAM